MSQYAFSLPEELVRTLEPFSFDGQIEAAASLTPSTESTVREEDGTTKCSVCGDLNVASRNEARDHYKRDYHKLNIKRQIQNLPPLTEAQFDTEIGELDESISGSDASSSDSEVDLAATALTKTHLSAITEEDEGPDPSLAHITGSPYVFYSSTDATKVASDKVLAVYKSLLDPDLITDRPIEALKALRPNGHSIILMIGGGHFSGAVISHTQSKKHKTGPNPLLGVEVITHKSFHRYTTRRKQGGSQSASDGAKGKAKSAGSSLRRHNEALLEKEIHDLLESWKSYIDTCDAIYVRASGRSNRGILMNYAKAPIVSTDKRIRGVPFTTGRATSTEVKRVWVELTQARVLDKPVKQTTRARALKGSTPSSREASPHPRKPAEEPLTETEKHTEELTSLVRKSRAPRLTAHLRSNKLSTDFELEPISRYITTPTLLFYASSQGASHIVTTLLTTLNADPTITTQSGRTAYEVAANRTTSDAFRLARKSLGEETWDWAKAKVDTPLTKQEIEERDKQEKEEIDREHRKALADLEAQEADKKLQKLVNRSGAGQKLGATVTTVSAESGLRGMSQEARMKLERERRARAAEARMRAQQ